MATLPQLDPPAVAEVGERLRGNIRRALKVRDEVVRDLLVGLLAGGHILIEDYPGVGKTALARALARSIEAEYARVQCTADLGRFSAIQGDGPTLANRRAFRKELIEARGRGSRLRGLLALPPGGPG